MNNVSSWSKLEAASIELCKLRCANASRHVLLCSGIQGQIQELGISQGVLKSVTDIIFTKKMVMTTVIRNI